MSLHRHLWGNSESKCVCHCVTSGSLSLPYRSSMQACSFHGCTGLDQINHCLREMRDNHQDFIMKKSRTQMKLQELVPQKSSPLITKKARKISETARKFLEPHLGKSITEWKDLGFVHIFCKPNAINLRFGGVFTTQFWEYSKCFIFLAFGLPHCLLLINHPQ